MAITKHDCIALDERDPLAHCRERFCIEPETIYLDGNSLGALPVNAPQRIAHTVNEEWGNDLITSWTKAGWFELPLKLGDQLGSLVGAGPGQIAVCDNTSINLYKAIHATLGLKPTRNTILAHKGDFPTDLYIMQGVRNSIDRDIRIKLVDNEQTIQHAFDEDVAVVVLSHINYKTSALMDMEAITKHAHDHGALVVWDLCHSAGVLPMELDQWGVDFAVGCSYKYLNAGPGAPAFIYAAKRHHAQMQQPLTGWWSHQNPFDFSHEYQSAKGIKRLLSGTQPILSLQGVGCGLSSFGDVDMAEVRAKSMSLCQLFIDLTRQECHQFSLEIIGPEDSQSRGSHVSIAFEFGYPVVQAMIEQGVTGDFRAPNLMRFGFSPLYIGYEQTWDAVRILKDCLHREVWKDEKYTQRALVT